jgi:hypothetical protein
MDSRASSGLAYISILSRRAEKVAVGAYDAPLGGARFFARCSYITNEQRCEPDAVLRGSRNKRRGRHVPPPAATDEPRELHLAQPQRRADEQGYVLVAGNYQSGISVVDFTDPAEAHEIAYADPAPLVDPNPPVGIELGGDWSTYWCNGAIYESDISRGLIIWRLSDPAVAGARNLGHLNPQTQESTIALKQKRVESPRPVMGGRRKAAARAGCPL